MMKREAKERECFNTSCKVLIPHQELLAVSSCAIMFQFRNIMNSTQHQTIKASTAMHAEPELANLQSVTALTATTVLSE